ncbi:MAG: isoleucine--tRNA ligase [Chitinophagaceae bacterium]|nr:isoleucine--tRNA ligase [Chitinophagaceae bacterium]
MREKYPEITTLNLPAIESEVLNFWSEHKIFEKSISLREQAPAFVFYEGPPSANGMPGIHHVISRTIKDLFCRYKTMKGFRVERKAGWDTHGLPVELGVEKELNITKENIGVTLSVQEFNQKCREAVLKYKDKWDELTRKMGYWVDLEKPYITFTNDYIETLWWLLKQLYNKKLLYQSISIQPYSPAAGTGLSSHELNQPGTYKTVKDTSVVAMFKALRNEQSEFLFKAIEEQEAQKTNVNLFFLAWTTTPWTLPSNLGLTVGPEIDYVLIKTLNPYLHEIIYVILAKPLLHKYFKPECENGDFSAYANDGKNIPFRIITECKGKDLAGCTYEQLLPFAANTLEAIQKITPDAKPFQVVVDDFVTTDEGTGIVHTAPAFGADDFKVGKKYKLGILTLVDREGKFVDGMGEFSGRYVKNFKDLPDYVDVNVDLAVKLKKEGKAFKIEKYEHNYPHCWRTDKPVLYYPLDAWFIKTTALKDRMVELNKTIHWKPQSTGEGRFGNWLENVVDWNLSRSRFWGTPLPIWRTEDETEEKCIGSIEELIAEMKKAYEAGVNQLYPDDAFLALLDLHKPFVDEIILVSESGKPMKRVPDLADVWFDSGAMPYAQWGLDPQKLKNNDPYPFKEPFEKNFPADFIAEGVDQTRGWFYTLHALAVLLFDSVAYKTVVSNGLVLDKNGNKMSKRLGNVVDPFETINRYGADATRWYLVNNASPWENMKFDTEGIKEVQRRFFGTLYNTYHFFCLYANLDGFVFQEPYIPVQERPEIDRWILSLLNSVVRKVNEYMDDYEPTHAGRLIEEFVDEHLSNWYVRLSRRRFWKSETGKDKISAYQTLYECLETVLRLMAPVSPFFSDYLFRNLNGVTRRISAESVHHTDYPVCNESAIDLLLEERMQMAQDISSLILSIRKKVNIKVRQPLQKALIPVLNEDMKQQLIRVEDLIKAEVNVKEIDYLSADNRFIRKKIKPNYPALGKKLGPKMKAVSAALSAFTQEDIFQMEKAGDYKLNIENEEIIINLSEVEITTEDIPGWQVASNGRLTVALDITITPELEAEGHAREFINRIQKIRKDNGFELTDRIEVFVADNNSHSSRIKNSLAQFKDYICAEILADKLEFINDIQNGVSLEIYDIPLNVNVLKKT